MVTLKSMLCHQSHKLKFSLGLFVWFCKVERVKQLVLEMRGEVNYTLKLGCYVDFSFLILLILPPSQNKICFTLLVDSYNN
jgi:hypothetical protein